MLARKEVDVGAFGGEDLRESPEHSLLRAHSVAQAGLELMPALPFQPAFLSAGIQGMSCHLEKRDVRLEVRTPGEFLDGLLYAVASCTCMGPGSSPYCLCGCWKMG